MKVDQVCLGVKKRNRRGLDIIENFASERELTRSDAVFQMAEEFEIMKLRDLHAQQFIPV